MSWITKLFNPNSPQPRYLAGAHKHDLYTGTAPTENNVFIKSVAYYSVYDIDRMARALGKDVEEIVVNRWKRGSVEATIKRSALSRGRGKGSVSAKEWGEDR